MKPANRRGARGLFPSFLRLWGLWAAISSLAFAADPAVKRFDLPADTADKALKQFSEQAGLEVIFSTRIARDVHTHAVNGEMTAREAIDQMLDHTGLVVIQDEKTGALTVRREERDPPPPVGLGPAAESGTTVKVPTSDEMVTLNPFEVQSDSDKSYAALNSNSVTRFNTELSRLPISADIFDQTFLNDIADTSMEDVVKTYSAGAGFTPSNADQDTNQPFDRTPDGYTSLRGLVAPAQQRDGFLSLIGYNTTSTTSLGYTNTFDIERIEVINGPQALLYGSGGAGGVINIVSKRAYLGRPAFGSLEYQIDQYGDKIGYLDYGMGNDRVAVRVAAVNGDVGGRRLWIGGAVSGEYVQIAAKVFGHTVVRVETEQTKMNRILSASASGPTLTAASTANDARNGQFLRTLLLTGQIQASAGGGPSGAGVIGNGWLNWNNVDSLGGASSEQVDVDSFSEITVETQWRSWLSTEVDAGYKTTFDDYFTGSPNLIAPNVAANPLGVWALSTTNVDTIEPAKDKSFRASLLMTNDLFGGALHSQTILGGDFSRAETGFQAYAYYQADSNFNPLVNPAVTTANGRTAFSTVYWPLQANPIKYPLYSLDAPRISYNGVNYVRELTNPVDPSQISASDPNGVALGGGNYYTIKNINKGLYGLNYGQWLNGLLDTLAGFRFSHVFQETNYQGVKPTAKQPSAFPVKLLDTGEFSFDFGADYAVTPWLRPYFSVSDSFDAAIAQRNDPIGNVPPASKALGQEVGIKLQNSAGTISGSIALYHVSSKNEQQRVDPSIVADINPSGLNGVYGAPSRFIVVDRESEGIQIALTAAPTPDWRLRFSAAIPNGKVLTATGYNQLYNDQFYENAAGNVTYADGSVVYVPPTFNSKTLTETSTTAGAIPLTVAMMNSATSQYYANPLPINGQISSASNAAKVLAVVDPVHGPILTGVTGLPISQIQINPGFTPSGFIPTSRSGDLTGGYPLFSFNVTSMYTFPSGLIKGVSAGGTMSLAWKNRDYYYYSNGVGLNAPEALFYMPNTALFNLITSYEHKFKGMTWKSQLNVNNLFNHYHAVLLPDPINGWGGTDLATFDQQPRTFIWTNRFSF